jgi:hypothetical protein
VLKQLQGGVELNNKYTAIEINAPERKTATKLISKHEIKG